MSNIADRFTGTSNTGADFELDIENAFTKLGKSNFDSSRDNLWFFLDITTDAEATVTITRGPASEDHETLTHNMGSETVDGTKAFVIPHNPICEHYRITITSSTLVNFTGDWCFGKA